MFEQIRHTSNYEYVRAAIVEAIRSGKSGRETSLALIAEFTPYELLRFAALTGGDNRVDAILRITAKRVARM